MNDVTTMANWIVIFTCLVYRSTEQHRLCKLALQGSECYFNHSGDRPKKPPKRPYLCRFYRSGHCSRSKDCIYHHETWPCVKFHGDGSCGDGDQCRYSHQELTDETRPLLDRVWSILSTRYFTPNRTEQECQDSRTRTSCIITHSLVALGHLLPNWLI